MLLLLWHCIQRILISHWMFSDIAPSHSWVEIKVIFIHVVHWIKHILGSLQGWYMWDPMETKILIFVFTRSFLALTSSSSRSVASSLAQFFMACFLNYDNHSIIPYLEFLDSFNLVLKLGTVCHDDKNENLKWK